jgi:hypothetical protein
MRRPRRAGARGRSVRVRTRSRFRVDGIASRTVFFVCACSLRVRSVPAAPSPVEAVVDEPEQQQQHATRPRHGSRHGRRDR